MSFPRSHIARLPILLGVACVSSAEAQPSARTEHDRAAESFRIGRQFLENKDCASAIPYFVESLRHEQNVGARFNLAQCSRDDGRLADAWNQFKGAEQLAIEKNDERAPDAHKEAADLEPKVTKLRLVLPNGVRVSVLVDGSRVDPVDFAQLTTGYAVEPNKGHVVRVVLPEAQEWTRTISGAPGVELPAMVVELEHPAPAPNRANDRPAQRTVGLALGAAGVGGVLLGAAFGFVAVGTKSSIAKACGGAYPAGCNAVPGSQDTANARLKTEATIATISLAAGGGLLVLGAAIYLTARRGGGVPRSAGAYPVGIAF
jgi:hypothetical protein